MGIVSTMGYTDEHGDFPKSRAAFSVDAIATMFGSLFGLSPVTSYIESAGGVAAGSRTGLTAIFIGLGFILSMFFAPLIASIPPWATGGALVIVGAMMCKSLKDVKWNNVTHATTAFVTVITMPLTYSIAYGLIAGIGIWTVLELTFFFLGLFGIARPEEYDDDGTMTQDQDNIRLEGNDKNGDKSTSSDQDTTTANDMDKSHYSKTQELGMEEMSRSEFPHDVGGGPTGSVGNPDS